MLIANTVILDENLKQNDVFVPKKKANAAGRLYLEDAVSRNDSKCVCEFHMTSRLQSWPSEGVVTYSLLRVLNIGVSHS